MPPLAFGLTLANRGVLLGLTTPAQLLDLTDRAEASGLFDSVWVGDSLFAKPRLDALTLLAAIAGRTRRLRLGPACLASFPLRHPLVFGSRRGARSSSSAPAAGAPETGTPRLGRSACRLPSGRLGSRSTSPSCAVSGARTG